MMKMKMLLEKLTEATVDFIPFHQVADLSAGDRITKAEMDEKAAFPVFGGGTRPTGYFDRANREKAITIARAGSAGSTNFVESQFWATDVCFTATQKTGGPDIKYVYHFLKSKETEFSEHLYGGSMPKLDKEYLWSLPVPVPNRETQSSIVKALDGFESLEQVLELEIAARLEQFDFYRSQLLMPKNTWAPATLGEIGKVAMCKRIFKKQTSAEGEIPFFKIGTFGGKADAYIDRQTFEQFRSKYPYPKIGDVLLSASGTIGRRVVFDGTESYFQDSNIIWLDHDESRVLNRFLYHWYSTVAWHTEGGTISRLYNANILKTEILIPSMAEQFLIVDTLDTFESLLFDDDFGLQAAAVARRQQFEYFRDLIFDFKGRSTP
jgi:type I restriction enzyme S subunit